MVAGLQHDASVSKLKLLELERAVRIFTDSAQIFRAYYIPFLERRSRKIPFQSTGRDLRTLKKSSSPSILFFLGALLPRNFLVPSVLNPYILIRESDQVLLRI